VHAKETAMSKMLPTAVALATATLVASLATAQPQRTIDLRTRTDARVTHEVSFCARPSPGPSNLPGHAFVAFSTLEANGQRTYKAVGHTSVAPLANTIVTYVGGKPVSGILKEELYTDALQRCLVAKVDAEAYARAEALTADPLKKFGISGDGPVTLAYRLGSEDCVGFMTSAMRALGSGLKVPARGATELPLDYLRRVIDSQ
jgi:hypothetical protein